MVKLIFSIILFLLSVSHSMAQLTYTLEADQVTKLDNTTYNATGNVILKVRDMVFNADNITFHQDTENVFAIGNVKIKSPTQEIEAEEINYNIKNETGTAKDIKGFLAPFNYICAKTMERTGATTFTVQDAKISTCSGKIPDWSISMYSGSLELGGYINANHATANILDTPIIYVPKLLYPVTTDRQSGLLLPKIGFDSDKGAFLGLLFYWAPDIDFDMTFGLTGYTKSGLQELIEARYAQSSDNSFYAAFARIDDLASESDENVRWRAVLKNTYIPVKNLEFTLNGDHVSDYLYMRDFGDYGITEYNKGNEDNMFFEEARAKYYWQFADTSVYYRNDYEYRDTTTGYLKTRIERAPSFSIGKVITDIPFVIADYALAFDRVGYSEYNYVKNEIGSQNEWTYNRLDANATLYAPIDLKILTLTPYASIRYTRWENSSRDFKATNYSSPDFGHVRFINSESAERYSGAAGVQAAFKEIYKDYGFFRHGIENLFEAKYSPKLLQDGLPDYIENDRVPYYGLISYEMINYLRGKSWNAKLSLKQGYDMLQEDHATPLEIEFTTGFSKYVTNTFKTTYKHSGELNEKENERRFQYMNDLLTITPIKYLSVTGEYTFDTRIPSTSFNTSANISASLSLWRFNLTAYTKWQGYNRDLSFKNLVPIERGAILTYLAECWSLGFEVETKSYNVNMRDGQYKRKEIVMYVNFGLRGLGESRMQFMKTNDENIIN